MRTVTKDFLNENAYRNYPVDDAATMEPYVGQELERVNSMLADMSICIPKSAAACAFVSSISVTEQLVTVTIMGSQVDPFTVNEPPTTEYAQRYAELGAVVLAHVQARRSRGLPGVVVPVTPVEPGVGGWVVFGPGVLNTGSWRFSGPEASVISNRCVSRLDYSGVFTIGRQGFETVLQGDVALQGQQGLEVVKAGPSELSIRFGEDPDTVRRRLREFAGRCGARPETGTCDGEPIRRINGVYPAGAFREIVLALDKPFYAFLEGSGDLENLAVSSDIPLERFCAGRPKPPDGCSPSPIGPLAATAGPDERTVQPPDDGTQLFLEVCGPLGCSSAVFTYVSQKAGRPGTAVFEASGSVSAFGDNLTRLEIAQEAREWQLYGPSGASLLAYGPLDFSFRGSKKVQYLGDDYELELGPPVAYDLQGATSLRVTVDAPTPFEFGGVYVRQKYRVYSLSTDPAYELRIRGGGSWSILKDGRPLAAGPIQPDGIGTQVQQYLDGDGNSVIRTIGVQAVIE